MSLTATVISIGSSDLVKKILGPLAGKIGAEVVGLTAEKWKKYTHTFEQYLSEVERKHKYFSSQIFSNEGQLLENYYVPLTLQKTGSAAKRVVVEINSYPADLIIAYKDILIVDTAGMGKSTLLKFIFLESIKVGSAIPIFIELRKLSKEKTISNFINEELKIGNDVASIKLLNQCLNSGIFTFFLDGFDEISDDDKKIVSNQIIELKNKANNNRFILSSREEQSLAYLSEFHKFNIKPLSRDEAFTLIRKIAPDPKIASSLIEKVEAQPQNSLNEFLTNPLLVSLLVKSFLHSPVLPVRLSEFYRQVFDALFQNHDAKKELGGFSRKKKCNLDLDRFHKTLRALGVLTYRDNKLEFSIDDFLAQIERAKTLNAETDYSASNFQHDLLHAVPLFILEGTTIRWAHRSLQEYFAAAYICVDAKDKQVGLLLQLYFAGIGKNANLLRLCADIDGKTFKHVLVKKYLHDRLTSWDKNFSATEFKEIRPEILESRKSIFYETPPHLIVFPRTINQLSARKFHAEMRLQQNMDTGFAFLTSQGILAEKPEDKVKFVFILGINRFGVMDNIIKIYFHEKININPGSKKINKSFKNIEFNKILEMNDKPENQLNSTENFEIATQIIINISKYVQNIYSIKKMKVFYENVIQNEKNSTDLDITFG